MAVDGKSAVGHGYSRRIESLLNRFLIFFHIPFDLCSQFTLGLGTHISWWFLFD